jgi:hypothetical protein
MYLYEDQPSWLADENRKKIQQEKQFMSKSGLVRSFVAIATIAALLSAAYRSPAAELNRLVVTGIALDRVATRHAAPGYPQDARSRSIQGDVRVRIQVENGKNGKGDSGINRPGLGGLYFPLGALALAIQALGERRLLSPDLL